MPLTPEQKRLSRQKKKQKILDDVARLGKLLIQLAPTQSNLRTPLKPELLGMAWQYRHWWDGNNMLFRIHAFFRTMRQPPSSSYVIRKGNRINCIDARTSEWLCFDKDEGCWEALDQKDTDEYESFNLI